jgi:hypothetical protein
MVKLFEATVYGRPAEYYECQHCLYIQIDDPSWLEEAYKRPINFTDTGIMVRNNYNKRVVSSLMLSLGSLKSKVLDWGGGYGILVRLLRDMGIDAYWTDQYCENLFASHFEYTSEEIDLVTSFETLEHLMEPVKEIRHMLSFAPNLLISTEMASFPAPSIYDWDYYGTEHGQHIGFFRPLTIDTIANILGRKAIRLNKNIFFISNQNLKSTWVVAAYRVSLKLKLYKYFMTSKTIDDYNQVKYRIMSLI